MGMFDSFDVRNNKFGIPYSDKPYDYQTKDLECNLDDFVFKDDNIYFVSSNGRDDPLEPELLNYSGEIGIYTLLRTNDLNIEWAEFTLVVERGKVIKIISDSSYSLDSNYSLASNYSFESNYPLVSNYLYE